MLNTREPVAGLSHGPLVSIAPSATLREAAHQLYADTIGALVVIDAGGIAGVLTERDLVDALALGADPDVATVSTHLSAPVVTARPDDPVLDVALQMLDGGIRHVPLVDALGHPQGMVSLRDLIRPLVLQAMTPAERPEPGAADGS
jgi:CBS domain-containing protein